MEKEFEHKRIYIKVKTNMLKDGVCYFGEKDIRGEFENIYKNAMYEKSKETTTELFLINIFNKFKERGIAVAEIRTGDLTYKGVKMTDLNAQKTLETEDTNKEIDEVIEVAAKDAKERIEKEKNE